MLQFLLERIENWNFCGCKFPPVETKMKELTFSVCNFLEEFSFKAHLYLLPHIEKSVGLSLPAIPLNFNLPFGISETMSLYVLTPDRFLCLFT